MHTIQFRFKSNYAFANQATSIENFVLIKYGIQFRISIRKFMLNIFIYRSIFQAMQNQFKPAYPQANFSNTDFLPKKEVLLSSMATPMAQKMSRTICS